ncbi:DNA-3-methyladenine glycosylase family protein [Leptolyngbya sp. AN02str]|uniref:DNA-3-methyladenine glycosylase family protein n=1 Tax=Leptolyngbya sp. AN02str TaxID=3423363 RepID=UPI003D31F303
MDYSDAIATLTLADPVLGQVMQQVGDCTLFHERPIGTLFEALSESIIYQQLSGKAAASIHKRFVALYPHQIPTPEAVLETADDALRGVGLSRAKVLYVKDLAFHTLNGLPTLEALEHMEDDAIIQTVTQVKGIGRWTAQMLLIFWLHRLNVLPADDLGIRAGIRRVYQLPDLPNKKAVLAYGDRWTPYCTIASWYLWRSLEIPLPSAS